MYIISNTDQNVYIGQDFTNNRVNIKAENTGLFYKIDFESTDVIRENLTQIATTGLAGSTFLVVASNVFRLGEIVGWYATDGTTRKGSLRIESIIDATHVLVRIDKNNANHVLESGDKLQYLPDQFLADGDSIVIKTSRTTEILVKADASNTDINMNVTKLDATVKKKL